MYWIFLREFSINLEEIMSITLKGKEVGFLSVSMNGKYALFETEDQASAFYDKLTDELNELNRN